MTIIKALKDVARAVRSEIRMAIAKLRLRMSPPTARRLEIGSGAVHKPDWVTVDMCLGADVYWDLSKPLPFADTSFDLVYCSHVLEHFWYPDLQRLLRELHRVLTPSGCLLISVPDAARYVDVYVGKRDGANLLRYKPAVISTLPMDVLNYMFYMDAHHRFMFDSENLTYHCRAAGFADCRERPFDASLDPVARDYESLYMVCTKSAPSR